MKVFFDTEFTGLHKDTTLISIGLITEYGDCFYAEFNDYDKEQVDDWIENNVISNLLINSNNYVSEYGLHYHISKDECFTEELSGIFTYCYGNKEYIAEKLDKWFNSSLNFYDEKYIELVSDVSHYDMVLFMDIFGGAFNAPDYIVPACYDIISLIQENENCTLMEAFDLNREEYLDDLYEDYYSVSYVTRYIKFDLKGNLGNVFMNKHNSMWDAVTIKEIYNVLNNNPNPNLV